MAESTQGILLADIVHDTQTITLLKTFAEEELTIVRYLCDDPSLKMRPSRRNNAGRRDVSSSLSSNYDSLFVHRKNALYRRAAELTSITDCEIAIVVLSPEGELSQFSTAPMKKILRTYSRLCSLPHEIQTMESIQEKVKSVGGDVIGLPAKKDKQKKSQAAPKKETKGSGKDGSKGSTEDEELGDDVGEAQNAWETVEAILSMGKNGAMAQNDNNDSTGTMSEEDVAPKSNRPKRRGSSDDLNVTSKKHRLSKMNRPDNAGEIKEEESPSSEDGTPKQEGSPTENGAVNRKEINVGTPLSMKQKPVPPSAETVPLLGVAKDVNGHV